MSPTRPTPPYPAHPPVRPVCLSQEEKAKIGRVSIEKKTGEKRGKRREEKGRKVFMSQCNVSLVHVFIFILSPPAFCFSKITDKEEGSLFRKCATKNNKGKNAVGLTKSPHHCLPKNHTLHTHIKFHALKRLLGYFSVMD